MDAHGLTNEHVSLDTVLKDTLNAVANNCDLLGRETSKLVVQRRQKSLQNGDFCIPRGCFKMNEEVNLFCTLTRVVVCTAHTPLFK